MTTLSPLARVLVDTVESAALHQNHRARIWAELQQRVAAESAETTPHRWRASRSHLGWFGCIASVVLGAGILGAVHRQSAPTLILSTNECPPVLPSSCVACVAATPLDAQTSRAPSSGLQLASKEASPTASQVASRQTTPTRSKAVIRANHPLAKVTSVSRHPAPAELPVRRFAEALPTVGTLPLENGRERQVPSEHGFVATNATRYGGAGPFSGTAYGDVMPFAHAAYSDVMPFAGATEWLEIAPQWGGAPSPIGKSRLESSRPLKLTPPQFKLTAALIE